jgi:hypothetical protein
MGTCQRVYVLICVSVVFAASQAAAEFHLFNRNAYQKSLDTTAFGKAVNALGNPAIGNFLPMYDDQVAQVVRMCKEGKDIAGALDDFEALGVYLGNSIDPQEEATIVRASKSDVGLLRVICNKINLSTKKRPGATIVEVNALLDDIEAGNGNKVLTGLDLLKDLRYEIRNGSSIGVTKDKIDLWVKLGGLDKKSFMDIYNALLTIGLRPSQDDRTITSIIVLMNVRGDVVAAIKSLRNTGWNCRGILDTPEVSVIANIMGTSVPASTPVAVTPVRAKADTTAVSHSTVKTAAVPVTQ